MLTGVHTRNLGQPQTHTHTQHSSGSQILLQIKITWELFNIPAPHQLIQSPGPGPKPYAVKLPRCNSSEQCGLGTTALIGQIGTPLIGSEGIDSRHQGIRSQGGLRAQVAEPRPQGLTGASWAGPSGCWWCCLAQDHIWRTNHCSKIRTRGYAEVA